MLLIRAIGRQIKDRRDNLRITQVELADLADVSPNTLYKIERGLANPSLNVLVKITEVLGLQIELTIKDTMLHEESEGVI